MNLQNYMPSVFRKTEENAPLTDNLEKMESYGDERPPNDSENPVPPSGGQEPAAFTTDEFPVKGGDECVRYLSLWQIILLDLSYLGLNLMFLVLSVEVVPAQVYALVGQEKKASVLGGMVAVGAVITLIAGPLVGMESDRLSTRFGRRRPVMVVGTIFLTIGLLGMAFSAPNVDIQKLPLSANGTKDQSCVEDLEWKRCRPYYENETQGWELYFASRRKTPFPLANPDMFETDSSQKNMYNGNLGLYIPFYLLVIVSYVSVLTPYNALVADRSHHDQRGLNSGVMGGMILLGNLAGAALGLLITPVGVVSVYVVAAVILLLCICITVGATSEPNIPSPVEVPRWRCYSCLDAMKMLWIPLKDHDFRWVFITRFLMQMGVTSTVGFIQFWISDVVQLPNCWSTFHGVSSLLLPLLVCAAISSVYSGVISDKFQIRKSLVICASVTMAICSIVLAFLRGSVAFYVAIGLASVFGLAFGSYQAVDFALLMDILPDPMEKSRDIAVWHQALSLPQAFAVPIAGLVVDVFERVECHIGLGYIIMFLMTGTYFLLSGIFVTRIKKSTW